jgi:hypothetical protein
MTISDRLNNFMKNCVWLRALLYFMIASLPPLIAELGKYKSYGEISPIAGTIIAANCIFQGVIAVRAFIDQSISRAPAGGKQRENVELIKG